MLQPFDEFSKVQKQALESVLAGNELTPKEAELFLALNPRQVFALSLVADEVRRQQCGEQVSYVVNRNINFTNVCIKSCRFCAFSRDHRNEESYYLELPEVLHRVEQAHAFGATEVCIQAGLPPKMEGDLYIRITRAVKERFPNIHIHAFSPEEILYGAVRSRCSTREYLQDLKSAGLDTLPGTSAEILDQELRDTLAPGRITVEQWKQVITEAHQIGLRTTSTMMFGHLESPNHWLSHMLTLRDMQSATGGFTEFVPLGFVHQEAPLSFMKELNTDCLGPSGHQVLHVHALARLILGHSFRNIQASWVKEGEKLASLLLASGCNDLGGTLINESISTAAGAQYGQLLSPRRLRRIIFQSGRTAVERSTLYKVLKTFNEETEPVEALDNVENPDAIFGSYRALTLAPDNRFVHPNKVAPSLR